MISNILLYIFLFHQILYIYLLRLLKLILLLLLNVLLDHSIYLAWSHILLDLFSKFIEYALMLDCYSEQRLFELIVRQTDCVIFMVLFVFGEMPKDFSQLFGINDDWIQLEHQTEVMPGLKNDLWVVFLFSYW